MAKLYSYSVFVYPWREYAGQVETRNHRSRSFRALDASDTYLGTFDTRSAAQQAIRDEWMKAHGNPRLVAIEDATGRELSHGDMVTDFRGETVSMFVGITARGRTGTWKITVRLDHGRGIDMEYNASVYGVTVKEIREGDE